MEMKRGRQIVKGEDGTEGEGRRGKLTEVRRVREGVRERGESNSQAEWSN